MRTASVARIAPRKAQPGTPNGIAADPMRIASVAPTDAPDAMPRMNGSASGFCTLACMMTPASASPAPAVIASRTRGTRSDQMISVTAGSTAGTRPASFAVMMASVSVGATEMLPAETAQTATKASRIERASGEASSDRIGKEVPFL